MLNLTHIRIIQDALKLLTEAERAALSASPVEAQHATFQGIFEKASVAEPSKVAGAFLVFYRVIARDLTKPNTPEHAALRAAYCPAITQWHVANPPTQALQLLDPDFNAAWLIDAAPKIGSTLDFVEARIPEKIACAVRNFFGLGGYEDLGDALAIQPTNPTMKLAIEVVISRLRGVQPQWYQKNEATGDYALKDKVDDTRPLSVIRAINEAALKKQKAEERAAKQVKAREDARAAWQATKVKLVTELASQPGLLDVIYKEADRIVALGFAEAAKLFAADAPYAMPEALGTAALSLAAAACPVVGAAETTAEDVEKARETNRGVYSKVAREAVLMSIAERKPSWMDTNADGDLKFRRSDGAAVVASTSAIKEPGHFTRKGGAILRNLYRVVEQYGSADVLSVLKAQLEAKPNTPLDTKVFDDLFAQLVFKPTPEGLWLKEKAASETEGAKAEAPTNG